MQVPTVIALLAATVTAVACSKAPDQATTGPVDASVVQGGPYTATDISGPSNNGVAAYAINDVGEIAMIALGSSKYPQVILRRADGTWLTAPTAPRECQVAPWALNRRGDMAGTNYCDARGTLTAMRWRRGSSIDDPFQSERHEYGEAYGNNDAGFVVGDRQVGGICCRAFIWTPLKGPEEIPSPTGSFGGARDVNNEGQVVGFFSTPTGNHAFLWSRLAGFVDVGTLGIHTQASAINNRGEVVGGWLPSANVFRSFYWSTGTGLVDLGQMNGENTLATSINNRGDIVGWTLEGHAWIKSLNGPFVQLPALNAGPSAAIGINSCGNIVGYSGSSAVVWSNGSSCP